MLTRKRKNNGDLYFGPYSILGQAQQLLEMINKFFPLVKCSPSVFKNVSRPCNYYNIKQCLAPCKLTVEKDEYENYIHSIISILSGKYKEILKKIKKQMQSAAEDLNFEKAALLRNQIKALELLSQNQSVTLDMDLNLDIFGTYWERDLVSFYITNIREGKVVGGSSHSFKNLIEEPLENRNHLIEKLENERIFSYFLCQFYEKKELPSSILFECEKDFFQEKNLFTLNEFL
jgi:excinuclease ABC subunit C